MACPSPTQSAPEVFPNVLTLQDTFLSRATNFVAEARSAISSISGFDYSGPESQSVFAIDTLFTGPTIVSGDTTDSPIWLESAPTEFDNNFTMPEPPDYPNFVFDESDLLQDRTWLSTLASITFDVDLTPTPLSSLGTAPDFDGDRPVYDSLSDVQFDVTEPELVQMEEVSSAFLDAFDTDLNTGDPPSLREIVLPDPPEIDASLVAALAAWRSGAPLLPDNLDDIIVPELDPEVLVFDNIDRGLAHLQALAPAVDAALLEMDLSAIHARAVGREEIRLQREELGILNRWSAAGWTMPMGQINAELDEARRLAEERLTDINRDVIVEEARNQAENRRTEYQGQITREGNWLDAVVGMYNAALEFIQLAQLAYRKAEILANARLRLLELKVEAWRAQGSGFEAEARIQQLFVERYRAQVEAARAVSDLNEAEVDIYEAKQRSAQARADMLRSLAAVYSARVEAAVAKLTINRDRVAKFSEQTRLKLGEAEHIVGKLRALNDFKQGVYSSDVQRHGVETQSYTSLTGAQLDQRTRLKELDIRQREAELGKANAQVQGYSAYASAEASRANALGNVYQALTGKYRAEIEGETARVGTDIRAFEINETTRLGHNRLNLDRFDTENRIRLQENDLTLREKIEIQRLQLGGVTSIADFTSTLASGAMAAQNLNTGYSTSFNQSESFSCSGVQD